MTELHKKSKLLADKPTPTGKPVKPSKPASTKEESAKILVPVTLTEERIREIVRNEIACYLAEHSRFNLALKSMDDRLFRETS